MSRRGEWNVGQLAREKFGRENVRLIGFTTFEGTVTATSNWDEPAQLKKVNRGMEDSCEKLFHETGIENFFLNLQDEEIKNVLNAPLLERAVGVIYRPESERVSHYFYARLPEQFDGIIHFDKTRAVEPLDKVASWTHEDAPETFPEGI
jgi:erythromycin esterase-like protein